MLQMPKNTQLADGFILALSHNANDLAMLESNSNKNKIFDLLDSFKLYCDDTQMEERKYSKVEENTCSILTYIIDTLGADAKLYDDWLAYSDHKGNIESIEKIKELEGFLASNIYNIGLEFVDSFDDICPYSQDEIFAIKHNSETGAFFQLAWWNNSNGFYESYYVIEELAVQTLRSKSSSASDDLDQLILSASFIAYKNVDGESDYIARDHVSGDCVNEDGRWLEVVKSELACMLEKDIHFSFGAYNR